MVNFDKNPEEKSSGINIQGTQVLMVTVVIASFMVLKPIKEWFYTREEGIATERRLGEIEGSIDHINSSLKELDLKNEVRLNAVKSELKSEMLESNRMILQRMSEVTDRLINKIDKNAEDMKERLGMIQAGRPIPKRQKE